MTQKIDKDYVITATEKRGEIQATFADFCDYCADMRVTADFTHEDGYVVIKGETRGRAQYLANRFFGVAAKDVIKIVKPGAKTYNRQDYNCSDCKHYEERTDKWDCLNDYCKKLECYMTTSYTCKSFDLIDIKRDTV